MAWHVHEHCVTQALVLFTGRIPCSVQSSGDFPRLHRLHPVSNAKTNDSKRCAFRYRHDVVRCTDVILSIMIATKNKQWEGKDGIICDELCNPISGSLCYSHFRYFLHRSTDSALIIITLVYCLAGFRVCRRNLPGHQNPTARKKSKPLADKRLQC